MTGIKMALEHENPFDLQKASHYSSKEILDYWVDIADQKGGLVSILQPKSRTPMLLLGGKGSGKTHLMRYCSAPVQAAQHGTLHRAISNEGYVGIYVPAEGLNAHKFAGKGIDSKTWSDIFAMYFEIWLATSLLTVLREAVKGEFLSNVEPTYAKRIEDLFDTKPSIPLTNFDALLKYLVGLRKHTDFIVNNVAITRNLDDLSIPFSNGSLVFGLPELANELFAELNDPLFVYLIDELENFTTEQQKFLNTLIRYRKGNSTIKVGARLYGIKTYATLGSGEPIKAGSEFNKVVLEDILREPKSAYSVFAEQLIINRLRHSRLPTMVDDVIALRNAFEEQDHSSHWRIPASELVKTYDKRGSERPHIRFLRRALEAAQVEEEILDRVIGALREADHPLLEKLNTFLFYRRWKGDKENIEHVAATIAQECRAHISDDQPTAASYSDILSHFSSDLLAQMYRDARKRLPYAGLRTLIELSQNVPRNLLGILSHTYRRALFAGEQPFTGGIISVASQTEGAHEGAKWFWNDAQPDADVANIKDAIESLALLFRSIRFSNAPSECDLCTFSIDKEKLSPESRRVLQIGANWSHIIKIPGGSKNKNYRAIDTKFQLAPMLAPLWELSHHRRGTIELSPELANAIFDLNERDQLLQKIQTRVANMKAPGIWSGAPNDEEPNQTSLFEL